MTTETLPNETLELGNIRLRLRDGLRFELHEYAGDPYYVVKDNTSSSFYQVGLAEYAFISLLDGKTPVQDAVQQTTFQLGEDAFTIRDAIGICHWLIESRLAQTVDQEGVTRSGQLAHLFDQEQTTRRNKTLVQLNPLFVKFPIGDPEPFLRLVTPLAGWIASRTFFWVSAAVICFAGLLIFQKAGEFLAATRGVLAPNAWVWLTSTFIGMKLIHELAHGIFCQRFGGRVRETGVVFILAMPIPYVDVTSCWGFSSKWKRIAVSAAGMYIEVFLAAVAAILWSYSVDPVWKFHLFNIVLTGSLTTLMFNANFLMRFDGYYILADLLEIPNLYQAGQQYLHYLGKRYLLGLDVKPVRHPARRGLIIRTYGVAAFVWRIMICVSLSILASALFYGFGVVLALAGILLWIGLPAMRLKGVLFSGTPSGKNACRRLTTVTIPACILLIGAMCVVPWPVQVSAPATVKYKNPAIVRLEIDGFVTRVRVANGQYVQAGEVLLGLENQQLVTELVELKMEHGRSLVRSRGFHSKRAVAAYQSEVATRVSIEQQIADLSRRIEQLVVRAPVSGQLVATDLSSLAGRHLTVGTELFQIVDEQAKEVVLAISQGDFDKFEAAQKEPALFVPRFSLRRFSGTLETIEPTASSTTDIRLTSYAGGRLAVRSPTPSANESESPELVHPRFRGTMSLNKRLTPQLKSGSTGQVRLQRYSDSIAMHLVKRTRSWLHNWFEIANQMSEPLAARPRI